MVDDRHPVTQLFGHLELVCAEDDCLPPIAHLQEGRLEHGHVDWIEGGERFIHEQHVGVMEDGGDVLHLLLIALGKALGLAIGVLGDPKAREPFERVAARLGAGDAVQRSEVDQLIQHRHAQVEAALLGHVAPGSTRPGGDPAAVPGHRSGVGPEQAKDDPHRRRLARTVGSEEAEHLAFRNGECHPVKGLDLAEPLGQTVDLQHGLDCALRRRAGLGPIGLDRVGWTDRSSLARSGQDRGSQPHAVGERRDPDGDGDGGRATEARRPQDVHEGRPHPKARVGDDRRQ